MIQRVQSIFLALAALVMALLFNKNMSFASLESPLPPGHSESMFADGVYNNQDHIILLVLSILAIAIPLVTIFLFRNRLLQMKLSRLTIALVFMCIVLTIIFYYLDIKSMRVSAEVNVDLGYLLPVLAIIFLALALRFIKKDEKLVRSADRLR